MALLLPEEKKKKKKTKSQPNCSNLQSDLWDLIVDRLPCTTDLLRFRGVCSCWRSAAKTHISSTPIYSPPHQLPLLMLPITQQYYDVESYQDESEEEGSYRGHGRCFFLNLADKKVYEPGKNKPAKFSQRSCKCVGSSNGWLIYSDIENKETPSLFNPFLDCGIWASSLYKHSISKAVMWSDPIRSSGNYAIVAIPRNGFESKLVFARCGDSNWTILNGARKAYSDVICCGDYVLGLAETGSVQVWDFSCSVPEKMFDLGSYPSEEIRFEKSLEKDLYASHLYLVESSMGELLLVIRYIGDFLRHDESVFRKAVNHCKTLFFRVYEVDFESEKWEKVGSLGDKVLFLGGNQSISLSALDFPEYEKNSIYFTDNRWEWDRMDYEYGSHDVGVFNMGDGRIRNIDGLIDLRRIQLV